jgi:ubiquinone/menaquinone biosynthesis C-methylase UbiE
MADPMKHAKSIGYTDEQLASVPAVAVQGMGCGNPTALAALRPGETVLDLGCGGGLDVFLAARRVGPEGKVIGIDAKAEMIEKARENARKGGYPHVEFHVGCVEQLPFPDDSIDVVISNCVLNYCRDKVAAFREVLRVLRAGGRICIADLVTVGEFPESILNDRVWGDWLRSASGEEEYLNAIRAAGFKDVLVASRGTFGMAESDDRLAGRIVNIQVAARK